MPMRERQAMRATATLSAAAPLEHAVELFGKLGLLYVMVTAEDASSGQRLVGVVIKKRLVDFLDRLKREDRDE